MNELEHNIQAWRHYAELRGRITDEEITELEDHLRESIADLNTAGLSDDEAFLIAVKRLGATDEISREFARERGQKLWKQLVPLRDNNPKDGLRLGILLVLSALATRIPGLFGLTTHGSPEVYLSNLTFFIIPFLGVYFWLRRQEVFATHGSWSFSWREGLVTLGLVLLGLAANLFPFNPESDTRFLMILHLPLLGWILFGLVYQPKVYWSENEGLDFLRFTGESFIYGVLLFLGGMVLMVLGQSLFQSIGMVIGEDVTVSLMFMLVAAIPLAASYLAEAKRSLIENMAPVLARIFLPLLAVLMIIFLAVLIFGGQGLGVDRDVLILFDVLLGLVLAMVLYILSSRPNGLVEDRFDVWNIGVIILALIINTVALVGVFSRIMQFGISPNKVAALGENLILAANLILLLVLLISFKLGKKTFEDVTRFQVRFMPVYGLWFATVVLLLPPIFGFV